MKEEEQVIKIGDYMIEYADGSLKIICIHNNRSIAVIPSSGNCVVIVPVERGPSQFKTN